MEGKLKPWRQREGGLETSERARHVRTSLSSHGAILVGARSKLSYGLEIIDSLVLACIDDSADSARRRKLLNKYMEIRRKMAIRREKTER